MAALKHLLIIKKNWSFLCRLEWLHGVGGQIRHFST